uniref:MORN repeat-containing protein 5 n=1 Tax=Spongospora subterranea TaxID=70186 RepID=A0A0H5QXX0_9EUKA|eukprot:CRZ06491.1 hypothetical protein [Spongospora subterranea]
MVAFIADMLDHLAPLSRARPIVFAVFTAVVASLILRRALRLLYSSRPKPKYVGQRDENGLMTGKGKLPLSNGDFYEGEFIKGMFHGEGLYMFKDGKSYYRGSFKSSMFHGKGEEMYGTSNSKYVGSFKANRRDGHGRIDYGTGGSYVGKWKNGLKHGTGTLKYVNGDKFFGHFENGFKQGAGEYSGRTFRIVGNWTKNHADADCIVHAKKGFDPSHLIGVSEGGPDLTNIQYSQ